MTSHHFSSLHIQSVSYFRLPVFLICPLDGVSSQHVIHSTNFTNQRKSHIFWPFLTFPCSTHIFLCLSFAIEAVCLSRPGPVRLGQSAVPLNRPYPTPPPLFLLPSNPASSTPLPLTPLFSPLFLALSSLAPPPPCPPVISTTVQRKMRSGQLGLNLTLARKVYFGNWLGSSIRLLCKGPIFFCYPEI